MASQTINFLLDANVFIEAHRRYYAFDICPGFWDALILDYKQINLHSVDKVQEELSGKDQLTKWIKSSIPKKFFLSTDDTGVIKSYGDIQNWAQAQPQFKDAAKAEFARKADAWLIAYAKAKGFVVVTHEEYSADVKNKIPIPNVCKAFDVEYSDTFQMLRALKSRFVLDK